MDHEHLKDMGIRSVGQRLAILKAVYQLKVAHEIPIEPDAYIPPCEFFWPRSINHLLNFYHSGGRRGNTQRGNYHSKTMDNDGGTE